MTKTLPLSAPPDSRLAVVHLARATWHPIVYRKWVQRIDGAPRGGDLVAVHHSETEPVGFGLYNPRSEIAVRIVKFGAEPPDEAHWQGLLERAVSLRRELLRLDEVTDAYRVVHAEADGLSGLMVDKLGDVLSAEVFSLGMACRVEELMWRLSELCGTKHWVIRGGPQIAPQEGFQFEPKSSEGAPSRVLIQEFGTKFRVQFAGGHKTGFFCDQRDNRRQLATYCAGRTVLDLCCYTGGFAVQAKKLGGASEVTAVDLDEEPLKLARENANLNQVRVNFVQSDAFAYMRDMLRIGRQYDVVVLDPPKLITLRSELEEGTRKHFDLNRLAMQLVKPGGLLLSCSCAGLLPEHDFLQLLYSAARQAGPELPAPPGVKPRHAARTLQVLARNGAAADHPVSSQCPQTEYLKAVWMRLGWKATLGSSLIHLPETEPFVLAAEWSQEVLESQATLGPGESMPVGNDGGSWGDMLTVNETGPEAGWYLFRAHELFTSLGGNAGVSRTDLVTGETVTIAQRADFDSMDAMFWTPWGTALTGEESANLSAQFRDPAYPKCGQWSCL